MAEGRPHELWIGTYRGLSLLRNGQFVSSPAATALGTRMIWALHVSDNDTLWIGTESGLFRWKNNRLTSISLSDDMTTTPILSILEDKRQRLWLGGPTTVLRVGRAMLEDAVDASDGGSNLPRDFTPEIFAVSRETGVELSGGMQSIAALDGTNGAWFASNEGPVHIQSESVKHGDRPPPIASGQISVDGRHIPLQNLIVLQPGTRTLEINATPISLSARPGLQLRRKLIGFDRQWTNLPLLQSVVYLNLPPGKYTYRLEANWKGSTETTAIELPITQLDHFYRRPLFLCGSGLFLLFLTWLFHWLQVRQVTLRYRAIGQERNRVAREMHDTVVQSCIGVSSLLEAIASQRGQEREIDSTNPRNSREELLDSAREQITATIVEARSAIWDLRHPDAKGGLSHALRSLLERMTATQNTLVDFKESGSAMEMDRDLEHELVMTAREAVQNAVTHAFPERIEICLQYENRAVQISISDDGLGFEPNLAWQRDSGHFGLLGMQERMERFGGSCTIKSARGSGTSVVLQVPIRHASHTGESQNSYSGGGQ